MVLGLCHIPLLSRAGGVESVSPVCSSIFGGGFLGLLRSDEEKTCQPRPCGGTRRVRSLDDEYDFPADRLRTQRSSLGSGRLSGESYDWWSLGWFSCEGAS